MATWFWRHQCKPHTTCSTPCTRCASPGAAQVDKKTLTLAPWISSTGPAPARTGIRNSNVSRWIYGQPQDFQLPAVRDRLLTLRCWRSGQLDEGRLRARSGHFDFQKATVAKKCLVSGRVIGSRRPGADMRNAHPKPPFGRQLLSKMTNALVAGKISIGSYKRKHPPSPTLQSSGPARKAA
jgi:hypothetical protein